jgi:MFS family permease
VLLPLAFVIGRRPAFLIAVLIVLICTITAGASKSFNSHLISRIFAGIGTGATETLLPLIISDITFLDERNFFFGLYWSTQNCINAALLISLSYLTAAAGWRWYYWLFAITLAVSTLMVVFLAPETKFFRSPMSLNGEVVFTDEFGVTHVLSDEDARRRFGTIEEHAAITTTKRSFLQELKPWSPLTPNGGKVLLGAYRKIGKAFTSPAVIFSLLLSSISLGKHA